MNRSNKTLSVLSGICLFLMTSSQSVWAGIAGAGTIVYSPDVQQAVPTLSGWTLIVLGLLFGIIAFRVMRQKQHGRTLAGLAASSILVVGAATGVKLINDAHAALPAPIPLDIAVGSQSTILEGERAYQNVTNVPQRIRSITYNTRNDCGPAQTPPSASPICTVNLLLQPQNMCWLNTQCQNAA